MLHLKKIKNMYCRQEKEYIIKIGKLKTNKQTFATSKKSYQNLCQKKEIFFFYGILN